MRREIVNVPVDPMVIPEAAHTFAQRALREHQRAEKNVTKAVEHTVKSGQALLKAYDLCEFGQWVGFFEMDFKDKAPPDDETRPLTLRMAQRYMQLARDWSRLVAEHPAGFFVANASLQSTCGDRPGRRKIASPKPSAAKAQRAAPMPIAVHAAARFGARRDRSSKKHCASSHPSTRLSTSSCRAAFRPTPKPARCARYLSGYKPCSIERSTRPKPCRPPANGQEGDWLHWLRKNFEGSRRSREPPLLLRQLDYAACDSLIHRDVPAVFDWGRKKREWGCNLPRFGQNGEIRATAFPSG
jgi:hypothetical protein